MWRKAHVRLLAPTTHAPRSSELKQELDRKISSYKEAHSDSLIQKIGKLLWNRTLI